MESIYSCNWRGGTDCSLLRLAMFSVRIDLRFFRRLCIVRFFSLIRRCGDVWTFPDVLRVLGVGGAVAGDLDGAALYLVSTNKMRLYLRYIASVYPYMLRNLSLRHLRPLRVIQYLLNRPLGVAFGAAQTVGLVRTKAVPLCIPPRPLFYIGIDAVKARFAGGGYSGVTTAHSSRTKRSSQRWTVVRARPTSSRQRDQL